jgi:hypothetical protein
MIGTSNLKAPAFSIASADGSCKDEILKPAPLRLEPQLFLIRRLCWDVSERNLIAVPLKNI